MEEDFAEHLLLIILKGYINVLYSFVCGGAWGGMVMVVMHSASLSPIITCNCFLKSAVK